jgi:hypothetical protein
MKKEGGLDTSQSSAIAENDQSSGGYISQPNATAENEEGGGNSPQLELSASAEK